MTIEDLLKTTVYLRSQGQWARSSYSTVADLLKSIRTNDDMFIQEPKNKEIADMLSGYCLVQGIEIE